METHLRCHQPETQTLKACATTLLEFQAKVNDFIIEHHLLLPRHSGAPRAAMGSACSRCFPEGRPGCYCVFGLHYCCPRATPRGAPVCHCGCARCCPSDGCRCVVAPLAGGALAPLGRCLDLCDADGAACFCGRRGGGSEGRYRPGEGADSDIGREPNGSSYGRVPAAAPSAPRCYCCVAVDLGDDLPRGSAAGGGQEGGGAAGAAPAARPAAPRSPPATAATAERHREQRRHERGAASAAAVPPAEQAGGLPKTGSGLPPLPPVQQRMQQPASAESAAVRTNGALDALDGRSQAIQVAPESSSESASLSRYVLSAAEVMTRKAEAAKSLSLLKALDAAGLVSDAARATRLAGAGPDAQLAARARSAAAALGVTVGSARLRLLAARQSDLASPLPGHSPEKGLGAAPEAGRATTQRLAPRPGRSSGEGASPLPDGRAAAISATPAESGTAARRIAEGLSRPTESAALSRRILAEAVMLIASAEACCELAAVRPLEDSVADLQGDAARASSLALPERGGDGAGDLELADEAGAEAAAAAAAVAFARVRLLAAERTTLRATARQALENVDVGALSDISAMKQPAPSMVQLLSGLAVTLDAKLGITAARLQAPLGSETNNKASARLLLSPLKARPGGRRGAAPGADEATRPLILPGAEDGSLQTLWQKIHPMLAAHVGGADGMRSSMRSFPDRVVAMRDVKLAAASVDVALARSLIAAIQTPSRLGKRWEGVFEWITHALGFVELEVDIREASEREVVLRADSMRRRASRAAAGGDTGGDASSPRTPRADDYGDAADTESVLMASAGRRLASPSPAAAFGKKSSVSFLTPTKH